MIKEKYEEIKKKYNLPSYDDFNNEFEIQALDLEKCGLFYKTILRTILGKLSSFLNTLEPIASPNPQSMHSMMESNNLSDEDKQEIYNFYKELSYIYHQGCEYELKEEKEIMDFVKKTWKKWSEIKNKQKLILNKITQAWAENVN